MVPNQKQLMFLGEICQKSQPKPKYNKTKNEHSIGDKARTPQMYRSFSGSVARNFDTH
jgi:hypothetical protein